PLSASLYSLNCSFRFTIIFFFQAEDGIRDLYVTGVQTCALPIYYRHRRLDQKRQEPGPRSSFPARFNQGLDLLPGSPRRCAENRSEERRVGKEWRCRWSTYEEKKKRGRFRG